MIKRGLSTFLPNEIIIRNFGIYILDVLGKSIERQAEPGTQFTSAALVPFQKMDRTKLINLKVMPPIWRVEKDGDNIKILPITL